MSKQDTSSSAPSDSVRDTSLSAPDATTQPLGSLVDALPSSSDPTAATPDDETMQTDSEDTSDWNRFGAHVMPPGLREKLIRTKLPRVPQEQLFDTVPPERALILDAATNPTACIPRQDPSATVPLPETAHGRDEETQRLRRVNARPLGEATVSTARPAAERHVGARWIVLVAGAALLIGLAVWAVTRSHAQPDSRHAQPDSRGDVTVSLPSEIVPVGAPTATPPPEKRTAEAPPVKSAPSSPATAQQSSPGIVPPKSEVHDRTRSKPPRAAAEHAPSTSSQPPTPVGQSAQTPPAAPPPSLSGSPLDSKGLPRLE